MQCDMCIGLAIVSSILYNIILYPNNGLETLYSYIGTPYRPCAWKSIAQCSSLIHLLNYRYPMSQFLPLCCTSVILPCHVCRHRVGVMEPALLYNSRCCHVNTTQFCHCHCIIMQLCCVAVG